MGDWQSPLLHTQGKLPVCCVLQDPCSSRVFGLPPGCLGLHVMVCLPPQDQVVHQVHPLLMDALHFSPLCESQPKKWDKKTPPKSNTSVTGRRRTAL